ncbi:MAG: SH3-like domain-containing protein [Parvibaculaceae bacterium]|jgi:SH3-like domain-containing protein
MSKRAVFYLSAFFVLTAAWSLLPVVSTQMGLAQAAQTTQTTQLRGVETGLPLPRFVSLKSGKVNVRRGPSRMHQVDWVYRRKGLPVEVVSEFEHWRRIRDFDGDVGWVHASLLDSRRSGIIRGRVGGAPVRLYAMPDEYSETLALAEPGVLTRLLSCTAKWCRAKVMGSEQTTEGWVERGHLWGLYTNERLEN